MEWDHMSGSIPKRVSIRPDGDEFVAVRQPDGVIIFRNAEANPLRKLCRSLRYEIVSDTSLGLSPASW